jgi:hypothetical protein
MNERGTRLLETADGQISELITILSSRDDAALRSPCPGREKLGDGTVAACAQHAADTYHRIATFALGQRGAHDGADSHHHNAEVVTRPALLDRLATGRDAVKVLAALTNEQLDTVPPAGAARFCDGQRTVEVVLTSMLKHQRHQIDAVRAAVG